LKLLSFGLLLLFGVKGREIGVESASDFLKWLVEGWGSIACYVSGLTLSGVWLIVGVKERVTRERGMRGGGGKILNPFLVN
jgi:hypothetical protein